MQVQAEALAVAAQELQVKLSDAEAAMQERQAKLTALQARLAEEGVTLEASSAQVGRGRHRLILFRHLLWVHAGSASGRWQACTWQAVVELRIWHGLVSCHMQ